MPKLKKLFLVTAGFILLAPLVFIALFMLGRAIGFFPSTVISCYANPNHQQIAIAACIEYYRLDFGKYPQGTSVEISQALLGNNPKQFSYLDLSLASQNGILDRWNTPYDIQVSANGAIKITSAGQNRIFGDKDDYIYEQHSKIEE
ncbi:type II secretion system protein GspG [Candidatus Albibeggiatoa sp. nov. NOAA]|uniref:type II secretion system protein GspG n=1 Tax=Candidatus Albibeggiatoa sp. nov. NOAA TaxID=3162724 RepID=UPI003300EE93|nr:type II secretion system protein GspG [Thiotrichaceae bacterium]